jgi:glutamate-ammonia-ligase adenylyltransferase
LSASSDVDLILLYDHGEDVEESDGEKPLAPSYYFMRLTQRLIAAVSAPTSEGILYEIDMRLRPSGNKGPVATHIESFRKYQRSEAWTWEHMALTRARTIAGEDDFRAEVDDEIDLIIALPHDKAKIASDAVKMRKMILKEKPPRDRWDLKLVDGGLIDIEFIAQVASLCGLVSAAKRMASTIDTISSLSSDFAGTQMREELLSALRLYTQFLQTARLCLDGPFEEKEIPQGFADLLLRQTGHPDLGVLGAHLDETAKQVRKHFRSLLGGERVSG